MNAPHRTLVNRREDGGRLERWGRVADRYWPPFLSALGAVGLAIAAGVLGGEPDKHPWTRPWPGGAVYLFGVMTLVGTIVTVHRSEDASKLADEVQELRQLRQAETQDFREHARQVLV